MGNKTFGEIPLIEYEPLHDFIKETRTIRKEQIELNQTFHRKNPKSVEYYQQLSTDLTSSDTLELKSTHIVGNIMTNLTKKIATKKNKNSTSNSSNKNNISQPNAMPPKTKSHIHLMFQNLIKTYKRDAIFFDMPKSYDSIAIMKDFNVTTKIGKTNANLTVRAVIGEYSNLKNIVNNHGTDFSLLKEDFQKWLTNSLNTYDAKSDLNTTLEQLFAEYYEDPRLLKFLPSLEDKIIQALRKPTKQPQGFSHRINQIDRHWAEEAKEIIHIETIENELRFSSYEDSFPIARAMNRKFSIFIGPTNSGKTYASLNELSNVSKGIYLGPLRLMAHEGRDSLLERGIIANLITGEERIEIEGATHVSSTIEMCNMNRRIDVAVIDEIQMISDDSRGWAWSQALIGVPAKHVILVGSEESLPFIIPVIENLGEQYEIKRFERKSPLDVKNPMWRLKDLTEGDCVVVFSRKSALEMKNSIEAEGKKCSVIYGNLSPEVRKAEAAKFKSGENPILVATDAIGMGLNLPINRLFFSTMEKYDGIETRLLTISEIKQIAGRAGRFGLSTHGEVGILFSDNNEWKTLLHKAIYSGYEDANDIRIPIAPNLKQIQTICDTLGKQDLYSALIFFKEKMIRDHKLYKTANLDTMIEIASLIKNKNLDLATGLNYACVPIDISNETNFKTFFKWINNHIDNIENIAPALPNVITDKRNDSYSLYEAENYVKLCMAYRWLHYKYPEIYNEIDSIISQVKTTNNYIEYALHKHIVISRSIKR
jgi:ATP-dependent RNA helicase SUPV3L1/SUV3